MGFIARKKLKSGWRYYPVITIDGKKKYGPGFSREKDAKVKLLSMEADKAAGTFGKKKPKTLFSDFSSRWLEQYARISVKPRTYDDYKQIVRIRIDPFFGEHRLVDINPAMIQEFISLSTDKGLAPSTTRKTVAVLKEMFKHAEMWEEIEKNPARFAVLPKQVRQEMDYLNPEEATGFLEAVDPAYHPLFATAILTGARQGELFALRWSDLALEQFIIYIRRTYHPKHGFTAPKTRQGERAIIISPELVNILAKHKENNFSGESKLVFTNSVNEPIDQSNLRRNVFHPALERAGLRQIRFHDLRHTYAAMLVALGVSIKFLQKQLGHASITTTLDTYGHLLPEVSEGFGEKLDSLVFCK